MEWDVRRRPIHCLTGAVEKTRTSTGCPTATSTLRVYQFRHDRSLGKGAGLPNAVGFGKGGVKRLTLTGAAPDSGTKSGMEIGRCE